MNFDQWHETLRFAGKLASSDGLLGGSSTNGTMLPLSRLLGDHFGGLLWLVRRGRLDESF